MTIGIVALLLFGGFLVLNSYIYTQKQGNTTENIMPYKGTLTGEYVCLPHRDQEGPQTLECAFGLKTDANEYYSLDFNQMPKDFPDAKTGERISVTGTITPIELLSTDQWQKYAITGIVSVTDPIQRL